MKNMQIQCEKEDGTYEMVDYPDYKFKCGEDFCDGCGDCMDCQEHDEGAEWCSSNRLVFYSNNPKNKLTNPDWKEACL